MRSRPALSLLPAIALMAAGCSGAGDGTAALADQADRVADLLAQDRTCQASEALRSLDGLVTEDVDAEVREAVTTFVASARASVGCASGPPSPSPAPPSPAEPDVEPPPGGDDEPDDEDGDEGGDDQEDGGNGDGQPEDGGPGNGNEGRGNGSGSGNEGRGNGNGGPGRGNGGNGD